MIHSHTLFTLFIFLLFCLPCSSLTNGTQERLAGLGGNVEPQMIYYDEEQAMHKKVQRYIISGSSHCDLHSERTSRNDHSTVTIKEARCITSIDEENDKTLKSQSYVIQIVTETQHESNHRNLTSTSFSPNSLRTDGVINITVSGYTRAKYLGVTLSNL